MNEPVDLPVNFNGKEMNFPMELIPMGFSYKIKVQIGDMDVWFEPDEEKNYRAVINTEYHERGKDLDRRLLQAISETLHELLH